MAAKEKTYEVEGEILTFNGENINKKFKVKATCGKEACKIVIAKHGAKKTKAKRVS